MIKNHLSKEDSVKLIENFINEILSDLPENFEEKRRIGENDSYICNLIRNDSVQEFVSYVNQTNMRLSSQIPSSLFETNLLLLHKKPILIEYAAFFGSIQIFKYLELMKVKFQPSLWFYAIHSNNPELINHLEICNSHGTFDLEPVPFIIEGIMHFRSFDDCINEAIKCHHNEIANHFILERYNINMNRIETKLFQYALQNFNYELFSNDFNEFTLADFFYYNYGKIVEILFKMKIIDLNTRLI